MIQSSSNMYYSTMGFHPLTASRISWADRDTNISYLRITQTSRDLLIEKINTLKENKKLPSGKRTNLQKKQTQKVQEKVPSRTFHKEALSSSLTWRLPWTYIMPPDLTTPCWLALSFPELAGAGGWAKWLLVALEHVLAIPSVFHAVIRFLESVFCLFIAPMNCACASMPSL